MIKKINQNLENSRLEGKKSPAPMAKQSPNVRKEDDNYEDDDYNNDFEEDKADDTQEDQLSKLRKALDREKVKALKHKADTVPKPVLQKDFKPAQGGPMPALDSFARNKGLIVGERVDHVAAN